MNLTPEVSICIATFNGEKYLSETLETLSRQTFRDIEVIVADDGSDDSTCDVVSDWVREVKFPVRLLRSETNEGPSAAYSRSFAAAHGEFLVVFSQDDLMAPNHVESVLCQARQYPKAVVVPTRLSNVRLPPKLPHTRLNDPWTVFLRLILRNQIGAPGTLIRRSAWRADFLGRSNFLTQDQEMWLNLSLVGPFAPPAGDVKYRLHESNLHRSHNEIARQLDVGLMFYRVLRGDVLRDALRRQPEATRTRLWRNIETAFMSSSTGAPVIRAINEDIFSKRRLALDDTRTGKQLRELAESILTAYGDGSDWSSAKRRKVLSAIRCKVVADPTIERTSIIPLLAEYPSVREGSSLLSQTAHSFTAKLRGLVKRRALTSRLTRALRYRVRCFLFDLRMNSVAKVPRDD